MNTIELMLKPLRTALEAVEAQGLADDEYTVGLRAAIAAGEAELRREINELRERVVVLERKPLPLFPQQPHSPVPNTGNPWPKPPFEITCGSGS
jgi:hypothetical protein